jgi:coproporphyrinogen III oxidase-like Fe-S oxidoreductase
MSGDCSTKFAACINNLSEEKIQFLASNKVDQLDIGIQTFDEEFRRILPSSRQQQNAKLKLRREL